MPPSQPYQLDLGPPRTASHDDAYHLIDASRDTVLSAPARTVELLAPVMTSQLRRDEPALSANGELILAQAYMELGSFRDAITTVWAARVDFLASGHADGAHRAVLLRAHALAALGEYANAIECAATLHDLSVRDGEIEPPPPAIQVAAHIVRARASAQLGDRAAAVHHFDLAWDQAIALGDRWLQAKTEQQRGASYVRFDVPRRGLADLRNAHRYFVEHGMVPEATRCAVPLAEALKRLGSPHEAISILDAVEEDCLHRGAAYDLARVKTARAEVLLHLGLCQDGHDATLEAVELLRDLDLIEELGYAHLVAGQCSAGAGDLSRSRDELMVAGRFLASSNDPHLRSRALVAKAMLALYDADLPSAHRFGLQAVAVRPDSAAAELTLAAASADTAEGREHLDRVADLLSSDPEHPLWLAHQVLKARVLRREGQLHGARSTLMSVVDTLTTEPEAPGFLSSVPQWPIGSLIDELTEVNLAIWQPDAVATAWQWANAGRTTRIEVLAGSRSDRPPVATESDPVDDLPVSPEHEPSDRDQVLHDLSDAFDLVGGPDSESATGRIAQAQEAALRALSRRLVRSPVHARGSDMPLPEVPEGPVLQLHVLGRDVVVFVIREGQVHVHRITDGVATVCDLLDQWSVQCTRMTLLEPRGEHSDESSDVEQILCQLSSILLDPVSDLLEDLFEDPLAHTLMVVTHRHLDRVPFEALPTSVGTPLGATVRLAFAHEPFRTPDSAPVAVVGPVGPRTLVLAVPDERAPQIGREADFIATIRPVADVAVAEKATTTLLANEGRHHDLVHIAAHGMWDATHPLRSALRLGDRWLTAAEILEMDLSGSVVVLNACASGRSWESNNEVGGLVWALLATGCRGVVATQWPVQDETALEFARSFHTLVSIGHDPADAVTDAIEDLSTQKPHPWHWAAFRYISSH